MFNIQGITMGRQMAIELLRCVRTGRWSSHPYLLPDRWSLYRDALASLHALVPLLPILRNNSKSQHSCNSGIRVFFAQGKTLERCFFQINILSSYLIPSTIWYVRADQISSLVLWRMYSIEGKRIEYDIRKMCCRPFDNEHCRENQAGWFLSPDTTSLIFPLHLHKALLLSVI